MVYRLTATRLRLGTLVSLGLLESLAFAAEPLSSGTLGPAKAATLHSAVASPSRSFLDHPSWWLSFDDPLLSAFMQQALEQNLDVRAAQLRVSEAKTVVEQRLAPRLPTLSWDTGIDLAPTSSLGFRQGGAGANTPGGTSLPTVYWNGSSALNAGFELDILGYHGLQHEASRDDLKAAQFTVQGDALSILTRVATSYFDLVTARARAAVVEQQVQTAERLLAVTLARFESGQARATDILQQRQQLASTLTLRPQAVAQVRAFSQQLAVLLGQDPRLNPQTATTLPALPNATPALQQERLLGNRPNLRAAQLRATAASKREESTPGYLSPRLTLSATAGIQAIDVAEVNQQWYWGAGARLSIPLFAGGGDLATLKQRRVQAKLAANTLQRLKLESKRQLQAAHAAELERAQILQASLAERKFSSLSYKALRDRYLQGEGDVTTLLTAFNAHRQAELNFLTARRNLIVARVNLHSSAASSVPVPTVSGSNAVSVESNSP